MNQNRISFLSMAIATIAALSLSACGDDGGSRADAGNDAGSPQKDSGPNDAKDSSVPGKDGGDTMKTDAGHDAAMSTDDAGGTGAANEFEVPAKGGKFEYQTDSGVKVVFDFPKSAAGKNITVTTVDPDSIDWADDSLKTAFSEVFKLEPSGTVFTDPIEVTFDNGTLSAFLFSDGKNVPEPLPVTSEGKFLIKHFSIVGLAPPGQICDSTSPWTDDAASGRCTELGAASTYRHASAKCYRFCYTVEAGCCIDPSKSSDAAEGCDARSPNLTLAENRVGPNGESYPYCAEGLPTLTTVTGTLVAGAGDQPIELTGTNFAQGGSAMVGQLPIPTVVHSATSATATVPAASLTNAGALSVRFANPKWSETTCTLANIDGCDYGNWSAAQSIDVGAAVLSCLTGGTALPNANSGTCADPYMVDLREAAIGTVVYKSVLGGAGADSPAFPGTNSNQQCGFTATARDLVFDVMLPAGADVDVSVAAATNSNAAIYFVESAACNANSVSACGNDAGSNACEVVAAKHGTHFYQPSFFVAVSEDTASGSDLTVRFALRGTRTIPTLLSLSPNPAGPSTVVTATTSNGTGTNAYAVLSKLGSSDVEYFCDPTSDNTCDFTVPANGGGFELADGTYDVKLVYKDTDGMPSTNSVSFTKSTP